MGRSVCACTLEVADRARPFADTHHERFKAARHLRRMTRPFLRDRRYSPGAARPSRPVCVTQPAEDSNPPLRLNGRHDYRSGTWISKTPAALRLALVVALVGGFAATTAGPPSRPSRRKPRRSRRSRRPGSSSTIVRYFEHEQASTLPWLHEPVQRHVFRPEDGRHRDHSERCAAGHRRGRAPVADARAVGPDRRLSNGRSTRPRRRSRACCAVRGVRLRSRLVAHPEGTGFRVAVYVDKPIPEALKSSSAGLQVLVPAVVVFERTYLADGQPGIFPRYPIGPTETKPGATKMRQFEGYSTFTIVAGTSTRKRTRLPTTGKVAGIDDVADVICDWTRKLIIGCSPQAIYHARRIIIDYDANDTALPTASCSRSTPTARRSNA